MSGACEYTPYSKKQHQVDEVQRAGEEGENKQIEIFRLIAMATILIFVSWMHLLQPVWLSNIVTVIAVMVGGYPLYKESFIALKKGRVNMELSMVIAIVASLILSQYLPAIAIAFFALLSEFIEGFIVQEGRKNIQILYNRSPKNAIVRRKNSQGQKEEKQQQQEEEIPVTQVKVDDIVIVREGDIIPVDGHIINGISTVDQSSITGESIPVEKSIGDTVFAGTINLTHQLEVKCDKLSTDTTFAKIIHLVEEAEASKAPIQKLSDKLATRLIQFAIGLSLLTFIVTQNIVSTLSVVVVAGACGLAVGTPIALLAANSKLARRGIIVKGGIQIENLKHAGTIVFDKTGTLTLGRPVVSQVVSFVPDIEPKYVLECAAIAEKNVNHPIAKAIEQRAIEEKIRFEVDMSSSHAKSNRTDDNYYNNNDNNFVKVGRGVTRIHNGRRMSVGNLTFMEEEMSSTLKDRQEYQGSVENKNSYSTPSNLKLLLFAGNGKHSYRYLVNDDNQNTSYRTTLQLARSDNIDADDTSSSSTTFAFVSVDRKIIGAVLLEDKLREGAREAISKIKAMDIHVIMLTGDNDRVAKRIADEAGIKGYYANLLPHDKVSKINEIVQKQKERKKTVIMVGDGINDAPALAKADV
ncbi:MAG TPA: cation-translocating P-type ATPase, partial [Nitrososphaeraceae archaeon]|nr:cation-translocating P-type ATPase [Nitrososphaeraceae archaeon]